MTQSATKKTLRPLGSRVLAKRMDAEETLPGGIILPDSAKQKQESAEVIATGPGAPDKDGKMQEMPVKPGDQIFMDKYSGQEVTIDDVEYIIVKAEDIIAVIE